MGHLRRPQANSDLDDIWYYIATSSGSVEIADRLVDSLTDRFVLLGGHPNLARTREGLARQPEPGRPVRGQPVVTNRNGRLP